MGGPNASPGEFPVDPDISIQHFSPVLDEYVFLPPDWSSLSDYDQKRLLNIYQNAKVLARLGQGNSNHHFAYLSLKAPSGVMSRKRPAREGLAL